MTSEVTRWEARASPRPLGAGTPAALNRRLRPSLAFLMLLTACPASPSTDAGECPPEVHCEGACTPLTESPSCNADCTTASCGDGKVNGSAGEQCDVRGGADTALCNGRDCTLSRRGGGYLNTPPGEEGAGANPPQADACPK